MISDAGTASQFAYIAAFINQYVQPLHKKRIASAFTTLIVIDFTPQPLNTEYQNTKSITCTS